ncbi:MAG: cupin domain-containing protein [Solirubrobacteraceae bacterium]
MPRANIDDPEWDAELPGPHSLRAARVGAHAGARELGATLYEIAPGGAVSPYHLHHANEELLIVLAGRPRLRTPEGVTTLDPGTVVAFPPGPDGAHRISNAGPDPARVLVCSTMRRPEVAEHLDTGTWLAMTGVADGKVFPGGADVSIAEVMQSAMAAGAAQDDQDDS